MNVSVVLPVHNAAPTLPDLVSRLRDLRVSRDLLVVDGGSTDATARVLADLAGPDLRVVRQERPAGRGAALRAATALVHGDVVLVSSPDPAYGPESPTRVLAPLAQEGTDAVFGSRWLMPGRAGSRSARASGWVRSRLVRWLYGQELTDVGCAIKAFRTPVLRQLTIESDRDTVDAEIAAKLLRLGARVREVAVPYDTPGRPAPDPFADAGRDMLSELSFAWTLVKHRLRLTQSVPEEALHRMEGLAGYNEWVVSWIERDLGRRILEIGSGIGTVGQFFPAVERVVLTDVEPRFVEHLARRFAHRPEVSCHVLDGADEAKARELAALDLDTVVCINCLEHIEHDDLALANMHRMLVPGGKVLLVVPAMKALYGTLDVGVRHYRRYSREELVDKVERAGFVLERVQFQNLLGAAGWFVDSRILKRRVVPHASLLAFRMVLPAIQWMESRFDLPAGQSLVLVARKPGTPPVPPPSAS
jgi:SAM-dependent methyltransferase